MFQFPVTYQATAWENISFGDIPAKLGDIEIEKAAKDAQAHEVITRLIRGYNTLLGKWFKGGTELSAGEWQRVALARTLVRRAQFIILDEPTSFIDSWTEADWLESIRALAHDRTVLIITHRFTAAMRADAIHLIQQGRIVESGRHDELLARGGLYAKSWTKQMQASPEHFPLSSLMNNSASGVR